MREMGLIKITEFGGEVGELNIVSCREPLGRLL